MLELPKTTEYNKRIPKQKFYEKVDISPTVKKIFVEQVKTIYWRNKIAATTTNLAEGTSVTELEVFEIKLSSPIVDEAFFRQIDKKIPYHILFLLNCKQKYQVWIGYKEIAQSKSSIVTTYYHTDWLREEEIPLKLEGLSVDIVYENFVRQIAGERLNVSKVGESLQDSVVRDEQSKKLQKQIEKLQIKIKKEKQLNRQMELNKQIKQLKRKLEKI